MLRASAGWVAARDALPTSVQAVLGYYADSGVFDYGSLRLKSRVDDVTEGLVEDAFAAVEDHAEAEFGVPVDFGYDTKLILPAKLTLGYLYRRDDCEDDRADRLTRLVVEALVDGDMRDAINDEEYDDFEVAVGGESATDQQRRRAAELAQRTLEERVEELFSEFPEGVREAYERAVEVSERHQEQDPQFRRLMARAEDGDGDALKTVRVEYRDADFPDPPEAFGEAERGLPYIRTQYDRVGVIYEGMVEMYRAADLPVSPPFERSIVLAIIGAQVWLDDVDDYAADMREGQLTPVTAEYLLAGNDREAYDRVVDVANGYLDLAKAHATAADSALTGIATEYIYRDGEPELLPGSR
jgi:hypothetical protein